MDVGSRDIPTALIHLYRGELGRMTVYRTRMDQTTNWAVVMTATLTTFALGQERVPHTVFLLMVFLDLVFLWMEARRFRFYELVRRRVRLLELGFYAEVLGRPGREGWQDELWESLRSPCSPITQVQAASVRLQRHYLWLLAAAYGAWGLKLWLQGRGFVEGARVGALPGALVLVAAGALLCALFVVARVYHLPEEE